MADLINWTLEPCIYFASQNAVQAGAGLSPTTQSLSKARAPDSYLWKPQGKGLEPRSSLGAPVHRSYPERESDSSSSGTRHPKLDFIIEGKKSDLTGKVASPPPASTGSKEVVYHSTDLTKTQAVDAQESGPTEGQKTHSSTKTWQSGDDTTISVSRQIFHLYYWLSAVPTSSTDEFILNNETHHASTESVPEQLQNRTMFDVDLKKFNGHLEETTAYIRRDIDPVSFDPSYNLEVRGCPVNCLPRSLEDVEMRMAEIRSSCTTTDKTQIRSTAGSHVTRRLVWAEDSSDDAQDPSGLPRDDLESKQAQKKRCQRIVRLAKQVYQFLLPLRDPSFESWVTTKFWGAVYWYLENPEAEGTECILDNAIRHDLKGKLSAIAEHLQYGPHPGTIQILGQLGPVLPVGLVALLVNRLMKDITKDAPDIVTTYYDYMLRLEHDIQKRPHRRVHQEKLSSFRQETNCVIRVLEHQISVVSQLKQMLYKGEDVIAVLGRRQEDLILQECLTTLEDRIDNFNNLERHARDLASFNLLRIESTKDRQEAAILVFTLVTIIFLPLSFVSSFFGMNTIDIRDTKFPQWIFWVSAVPLTVLVVILALFMAQMMEPLKDLWSQVQDRWIAYREAPVEYYISRRTTVNSQADGQDMGLPNQPEDRVRGDETDGIQLRARRHPNEFVSP
ncbi:MAG: hypothetical protein L6R38_006227 [Xanthoria sp. 2 TBL-2021]|nr:MAG: hypothetical protein L6R38_006227 [Xanthoria sp. 2 TBL-2021]